MSNPIALTQETYDRFDRAAAFHQGGNNFNALGILDETELEVLRVSSSTIGTYGYPAKFQRIDPSAGTWADDADRPSTVYVVDPGGGAFVANQYAQARFACCRGSANESVYVAVKQSTTGVTTTQTIVTDVTCSGSTLIVTKKTFTWTNGVLTAVV